MRKAIRLGALLLALATTLTGCQDQFDYSPYDTHISGQTGINTLQTMRIEALTAGRETFRFAFFSDSHLWQNHEKDIINYINLNPSIDFVIHGGDITDYGSTPEYEWARELLARLNKPYVVMLGNHDCLGTGRDTYHAVFGPENFSFIAGRVKFVCVNTNALDCAFEPDVPNLAFMLNERTSRRGAFDRTVMMMHAKPDTEQFNPYISRTFERYALAMPGLMFTLCGHEHRQFVTDLYQDGNTYYGAPGGRQRSLYLFTIYPDRYEYEIVDL